MFPLNPNRCKSPEWGRKTLVSEYINDAVFPLRVVVGLEKRVVVGLSNRFGVMCM